MRQETINELRCFCGRKPLLAVYGVNNKKQPYLHVKIYKARRIYGEIVVTEGVVHLCCRECLRWHRIYISGGRKPRLEPTEPPEPVADEAPPGHV